MQLGVLGPVVATDQNGEPLALGGQKQRGALALLALHANRPVAVDVLARGIWDAETVNPGVLQPLMSRLRRALHAPSSGVDVQFQGGAYILRCAPDATDLLLLDRLRAEVQGCADPSARLRLLDEALGLWRGPALADVLELPFAPAAAERLEQQRLDLLESWAQACLRADGEAGTDDVATRLAPAAAAHPDRERLQALLMLAHYRAGRHVEALATYTELRDHLIEFGLEPGPELQSLHAAVLRHDPSLDGESASAHYQPERRVPRTWTSFVGRDAEQEEIARLLEGERLVTLTGAGGAGKTRLAIELATAIRTRPTEDVWFIDLAPLREPAMVARAVAAALSVPEQPNRSLAATIAEAIGARRLLLVLDNCEHLLAAAGELAHTLLRSCSGVRILTTSREPLRMPGEVTWAVAPLATPDPDDPDEVQLACASVQLFLDRARAARPGFELPSGQLAAVTGICRRLDGIPLALELAAVRLRVLGVEEIAGHLAQRLTLLSGGGLDPSSHHETLQGALDWSFDLLTEDEQALLPRLAVFAGGATLATVQALYATELEQDLEAAVFGLAEKSLLVAVPSAGATRYRMLEVVREWAAELASPSDLAAWRNRHAQHHLTFAQRAVPEVCGPAQARWIAELETEHDNIRAALRWCTSGGDATVGLGIAAAMWLFWWRHGHISEGNLTVRRMLEVGSDAEPPLRAAALVGASYLSWKIGDFHGSGEAAEEALGIFQAHDLTQGSAAALGVLGMVARDRGDVDTAQDLCRQSLDLSTAAGDAWGAAAGRTMLATIARDRGQEEAAGRALEKAGEEFAAIGDGWGIAWTQWLRGRVALRLGEIAVAEKRLRRSIVLARQLQHQFGIVLGLAGLAGAAAAAGRGERAAVLWGATDGLERALGYPVRAIERDDRERDEQALAALLDLEPLTELHDLGAELSWDAAVDLAMSDDDLPITSATGDDRTLRSRSRRTASPLRVVAG